MFYYLLGVAWWSTLLIPVLAQAPPGSIQVAMENTMQIQQEAIARLKTDFLGPTLQNLEVSSSPPQTPSQKGSTITFHNPKAAEFFVDGTSLPDG